MALSHVARELAESNPFTVECTPNCLVFPVPRDANGSVTTDATSGDLVWSKVVCYRINTTGEAKGLVRQEEMLAAPGTTPPEPLDLAPPRTEAYFAVSPAPLRMVARHAVGLSAELRIEAGEEQKDLSIKLTTLTNEGDQKVELDARTGILPRN